MCGMAYEAQRKSRKAKLEEGWKRVEAFLDPETAARWKALLPAYEGPTALVKAALERLEDAPRKRPAKAG